MNRAGAPPGPVEEAVCHDDPACTRGCPIHDIEVNPHACCTCRSRTANSVHHKVGFTLHQMYFAPNALPTRIKCPCFAKFALCRACDSIYGDAMRTCSVRPERGVDVVRRRWIADSFASLLDCVAAEVAQQILF